MVKIKPHLFNSLYLFDYIGKDLNPKYLWAPWPILDMVPYGFIKEGKVTKFTDDVKKIRDHFKDYLEGSAENATFSKNYIEVTMSEFSKFRHIFHCMAKGIKIECNTKTDSKLNSKGSHIQSQKSEKQGRDIEYRGCCQKNDGCCCPPIRVKETKTEGSGPNRKVVVTCEKAYDNYPCSRSHSSKKEGFLNIDTTELYTKYSKDLKDQVSGLNKFSRTFVYNKEDESKIEDTLYLRESTVASTSDYLIYEKNWVFKKVEQSSNSIRVRKWSNIPDPIFVLLTQQRRRELNTNVDTLEEINHICTLDAEISDKSPEDENGKPQESLSISGESNNLTKLKVSINNNLMSRGFGEVLSLDFRIYRIVYIESSKKFLIFFDFTITGPDIAGGAYFLATPKPVDGGSGEEQQIPIGYELSDDSRFLEDYKYSVLEQRFVYNPKSGTGDKKYHVPLELKKLKITFSDGGSQKVSKELEYYRYSKNNGKTKPPTETETENCLSISNDNFSVNIDVKNIEFIGWSKSDFDEKYIYPDFK